MTRTIHRFDAPSTIVTGGGSRWRLGDIARELSARRVLLVTDPGIVALGMAGEIEQILTSANCDVRIFQNVQADPTDLNVADGVKALKEHKADLVVAVGGGSPIDTAKVIAIRPANPEPLPEFMGLHKIGRPGIPLVAVPTTAGTGSEASKVAVITDTGRNVKMMMLSAPLLPRVAIVDYELSLSMPKALTAAESIPSRTGLRPTFRRKTTPWPTPSPCPVSIWWGDTLHARGTPRTIVRPEAA